MTPKHKPKTWKGYGYLDDQGNILIGTVTMNKRHTKSWYGYRGRGEPSELTITLSKPARRRGK